MLPKQHLLVQADRKPISHRLLPLGILQRHTYSFTLQVLDCRNRLLYSNFKVRTRLPLAVQPKDINEPAIVYCM